MGSSLKTAAVYEYICDKCQKTVDNSTGQPAGWESWSRSTEFASMSALLCDTCGPQVANATGVPLINNLPARLTATPLAIPPDGTTTSTVTYHSAGGSPLSEVSFVVNGTTSVKPITDGMATLQVSSQTPNDTITITCEGLSVTVTVIV